MAAVFLSCRDSALQVPRLKCNWLRLHLASIPHPIQHLVHNCLDVLIIDKSILKILAHDEASFGRRDIGWTTCEHTKLSVEHVKRHLVSLFLISVPKVSEGFGDFCFPFQCWTGIIFIWYYLGICREDFPFFDSSRVWIFEEFFVFRYRSGLYIIQESSYLGAIVLVSIWLGMVWTQIIAWVYKVSLTLRYPPTTYISLVLQFWYQAGRFLIPLLMLVALDTMHSPIYRSNIGYITHTTLLCVMYLQAGTHMWDDDVGDPGPASRPTAPPHDSHCRSRPVVLELCDCKCNISPNIVSWSLGQQWRGAVWEQPWRVHVWYHCGNHFRQLGLLLLGRRPSSDTLVVAVGGGRIHHEHRVVLLDCQRTCRGSRCPRGHLRDRFSHFGSHRPRVGELDRGPDFEPRVCAWRGRRRTKGGQYSNRNLGMLRRADVQHARGLGALICTRELETVPETSYPPGRRHINLHDRVPVSQLAVVADCASVSQDGTE